MPHTGTYIPEPIAAQMLPTSKLLDDNDWHLPQLYEFAKVLGASILIPIHSRYVVDLNRHPDNANLYPGQNTTGLCPIDTFLQKPLYAPDRLPTESECLARRDTYWRPYHAALTKELARIKEIHGRVLLWEAHSIRSEVPRFFEGRLPDFNFGTATGESCSPGLGERLLQKVQENDRYSSVLNGRFKGGYITRAYGQPELNVHAVQLELSQRTYMLESPPYPYQEHLARQVQPLLRTLLEEALVWLQD